MNGSEDGHLVRWRFLLFAISIALIAYGVYLLVNLSINPPEQLKDGKKQISIQDISKCGPSKLNGIVSSTTDFLVGTRMQINISASVANVSNSVPSSFDAFFLPFSGESINANLLPVLKSSFYNQSVKLDRIGNSTIYHGQTDIIMSRADEYTINLFEYDNNLNMDCLSSSDQRFSIISENERLQVQSNREGFRNGIIIEALTWVIAGAAGVTFLAQFGLKEE